MVWFLPHPQKRCSFVRSFIHYCRQRSTLDPSAETLLRSNARAQGEEGRLISVCWCVCVTCRVKEGLEGSEQLVGYFYSVPPVDVAYLLASLTSAVIGTSPWLTTPISFIPRRHG